MKTKFVVAIESAVNVGEENCKDWNIVAEKYIKELIIKVSIIDFQFNEWTRACAMLSNKKWYYGRLYGRWIEEGMVEYRDVAEIIRACAG